MVKVARLFLLHLRFACGVAGDSELPPIWYAIVQGRGKTEGLTTMNQALMRGLPSFQKIFWGRAHFSSSLPLLAFVWSVLLRKTSLDPACARGGIHAVADEAGHG